MVDYAKHFRTTASVERELFAIAEKQTPFLNGRMVIPTLSKRQARLVRMYWIYRKEGK